MTSFPLLSGPRAIGSCTPANHIVASGHDTVMVSDGRVTDQIVAGATI